MIEFEISGLDKVVAKLVAYPAIANPILANIINVILAELHKGATDTNFDFKLPRTQRTGRLANSFSEGISLASASRLEGNIRPTVKYAPFVHEGTQYISANPFMPRIVKATQYAIDQHIKTGADKLAKALI